MRYMQRQAKNIIVLSLKNRLHEINLIHLRTGLNARPQTGHRFVSACCHSDHRRCNWHSLKIVSGFSFFLWFNVFVVCLTIFSLKPNDTSRDQTGLTQPASWPSSKCMSRKENKLSTNNFWMCTKTYFGTRLFLDQGLVISWSHCWLPSNNTAMMRQQETEQE